MIWRLKTQISLLNERICEKFAKCAATAAFRKTGLTTEDTTETTEDTAETTEDTAETTEVEAQDESLVVITMMLVIGMSPAVLVICDSGERGLAVLKNDRGRMIETTHFGLATAPRLQCLGNCQPERFLGLRGRYLQRLSMRRWMLPQ